MFSISLPCKFVKIIRTYIEKYKVAKKTAKRAVSVAKDRAYEDLYQHLSTKKGENDIYRMARVLERRIRDFNKLSALRMKGSIS